MAVSGDQLISLARSVIGDLYVYGAEGPDTFDCSGLVQWALGKMGVTFPRVTGDQWAATQHIPLSQVAPGDLVFFGSSSDIHHVAIISKVQGSNITIIEAPQTWISRGVRGRVQEVPLNMSRDIYGYGRIKGVDPGTGQGSFSPIGTIGSDLVAPFTDLAKEFDSLGKLFTALLLPATWVRISSAVLGAVFLFAAIIMLIPKRGEA